MKKVLKAIGYMFAGALLMVVSVVAIGIFAGPSEEKLKAQALAKADEEKQYCLAYHEDEDIFKGEFPRSTLEKAEADIKKCRELGFPVKNEKTMKSILAKRRAAIEKQEREYSAFLKKHGSAPENYEQMILSAIKSVARNPDSVEMISCEQTWGDRRGWEVICLYRAQNGFGGMNVEKIKLHYSNGKFVF